MKEKLRKKTSHYEKYQKTLKKAYLIKNSGKMQNLESNLKKLNEEFHIKDLDKNFDEIYISNNFEQTGLLNVQKKTKIQQLLIKKSEMDYLYIPECVRLEKERRKIKVCGIFSVDQNSDKCRCKIF